MSFMEAYKENTDNKDDFHWMPFKQYKESNETAALNWTEQDINQVINKTFPGHMINNEYIKPEIKKWGKTCSDSHTNICDSIEKTDNNYYRENIESDDLTGIKAMRNGLFQMKSSKEYWEHLSISASKKKSPKKTTVQWKKNYLNVLPLHRNDVSTETSRNTIQCLSSLNSDDSDSEQTEEMHKIYDPMYSRFGEIRDVFHTSEDGIVFYTQKELDEYKVKMADMKEVLHSELELIKHQHDQLKAKRAEERKLLSERMNSQEVHEEEPTEKDALNSDNNKQNSNKQERKSALFSSFTDAFSYARTGIQGIFVKNSPKGSRKMKTDNEDCESSDDEEGKLSATLLSQNPDALPDNHDEFTRKMTSEGGLKYTSSDKSDQQLSYQNLPPPLSLSSLPNKAQT